MQYFSSANINNNTIINYARKKAFLTKKNLTNVLRQRFLTFLNQTKPSTQNTRLVTVYGKAINAEKNATKQMAKVLVILNLMVTTPIAARFPHVIGKMAARFLLTSLLKEKTLAN